MVKEMQSNLRLGLLPVGFVDDAPDKQNLRIRGLGVLGTQADLPQLLRQTGAQELIIAMPHAPGQTIRRSWRSASKRMSQPALCRACSNLLSGRLSVSQLRNVDIADLLRREPVQTEDAAIRRDRRGEARTRDRRGRVHRQRDLPPGAPLPAGRTDPARTRRE